MKRHKFTNAKRFGAWWDSLPWEQHRIEQLFHGIRTVPCDVCALPRTAVLHRLLRGGPA